MKLALLFHVVLVGGSGRNGADAFSCCPIRRPSHHRQLRHRAADMAPSSAAPTSARTTTTTASSTTLWSMSNEKGHDSVSGNNAATPPKNRGSLSPPINKMGHKMALAGTILASSFFSANTEAPTFAVPPPAHAVEISSGAFVVQTNVKGTELVDARALLTTLIKNRKAVTASLNRVVDAVKAELSTPVWREIQREVLQIEGDVAADIQISAPYDVTQTLRDLSKGRLNFILNGEIVNLAVDESFGKEQDEVVIRVQGFKGVDLSGATAGAPGAGFGGSIADIFVRRWQERLAAVQELWDADLGLSKVGDSELTAGPVVVGGLALTVATAYGASYAFYENQNAAAAAEAEEKRRAMKSKKEQAAAGK